MLEFCPLVVLGPEAERGWLYEVGACVQRLDNTYGLELLLRNAAWLTFKEPRASFAVEYEADQDNKVRRFAAAIGEFRDRLRQELPAIFEEGGTFYGVHERLLAAVRAAFEDGASPP